MPASPIRADSVAYRSGPSPSGGPRTRSRPACALRGLSAATVLLAAIASTGCGGAGQGLPDDVLVVGQVAEPKSLDPHVATSLNDFRILANLYEGLVQFRDGTLDPGPGLAESWEVSDDGKAYTFHLRQGVAFHDGTAFDAEAVRFNLERLLRPDHPFHDTGPFPLAFFFEAVDAATVLDAHTVQLRLSRPYAPLLANLAYPVGFMVSPAAVRRHGPAYGRHPVGTGPFRFVEWSARRRVVLERNPNYWGSRTKARIAVFRPVSDPMTRVAELLTGGIDIAPELSPENVALLRRRPGFQVTEAVGPHLWFLILNTREGPFQDRRMRQAVNYAIDKQALVDTVLQQTAVVASGPVPMAFSWVGVEAEPAYRHDPVLARSLVRSAGYPEGVDVTLLVPQSGSGMLAPVQMATAIQADLARVGMRVAIETFEWNSFLDTVNGGLAGRADMAEMAWMTNDPDTLPYLALRSAARPERGGFNSGYYSNPRVDALIERARTATERDQRATLYRELDRLVRADAPWAFVASWKQAVVASDRVRGLRLQPSFFLLLSSVHKVP
jgi:peptide/nickel transport system substrate-binding protein